MFNLSSNQFNTTKPAFGGINKNNPSFKTMPYEVPKGGVKPFNPKSPGYSTMPFQTPKGGFNPGGILKHATPMIGKG